MSKCLVIGRTNVGKTEFVLRLAEDAGLEEVDIYFSYPDGFSTKRTYPIRVARSELVGNKLHMTRALQSIIIPLKVRKVTHQVTMVDSTGLIDGIHKDSNIRVAMSQTLRQLGNADLVIHVMDASLIASDGVEAGLGAVDLQIAEYMTTRAGYFICANKMDMPGASRGLKIIEATFSEHLVVGISALNGRGTREVRRIVARSL